MTGELGAINDSYQYNGNGLRTGETIGGVSRHLVWDPSGQEPLLVSDGTNSYVFGPGGAAVEQIDSSGKVAYLHHDQQGSTRLITGEAGKAESTFTYGPYGEPQGSTGTTPAVLGYDGQYTSRDTGLIYMRARTYDPATGQFLTVDPLAMETRARYDYAGDSPVDRSDPSGQGSEGEIEIPCAWPFCGPPPEAVRGVEEGVHSVEHSVEGVVNAVTGGGDEVEAEGVEEAQPEAADCGIIPTGAKPPRAAYRELEKDTGLSKGELSDALHSVKRHAGLPPDANTRIDSEGNVYDEDTGELIGNLIDEAHG